MQAKPRSQFLPVATVQERLDPRHLEERLRLDPSDLVAQGQLEAEYRQNGQTQELLELLLTRAEDCADDVERLQVLREAAKVCGAAGDPQGAMAILLTAFSLDPEHLGLADDLDRLVYETKVADEVLDAYLMAAARTTDPAKEGSFWLRMACGHLMVTHDREALAVSLEHISQVPSKWAEAYLDAVESHSDNLELTLLLADVCLRIGDGPRRLRCLTRAVSMSSGLVHQGHLHSLIANEHMSGGDRVAAEWHLREALRLDPSREDCMSALVELSKQDGDLKAAVAFLSATAFGGGPNRSEAAFQAAQLCSELDENTRCFDLLAVAVKADPNHHGAAVSLAERYYRDERWTELLPIIERLSESADSLSSIAPVELFYRGGLCAQNLGDWETAHQYYLQALRRQPTHVPSLIGDEAACRGLGDWETALQCSETLLMLSRDDNDLRALACHNTALVHNALGDPKSAISWAEQALKAQPEKLEAAQTLAAACEEVEDYEGAIRARQAVLTHVDVKTGSRLRREIASLRCRKLDDPMGAIEEYEQALLINKDDRTSLQRLLELFTACEMWTDCVRTILRIASMETNPLHKGTYYSAAGAVLWEKLHDPSAADCFSRALSAMFEKGVEPSPKVRATGLRVFHRLVACLEKKGDYEALEREYRRLLQRLPPSDPAVVQIWHGLGSLYQHKLLRPEEAIASFEVVTHLDDATCHKRTLVGLYEGVEDKRDLAIAHRLDLLARYPFEAEHYSALTSLYIRNWQPDLAWCTARASDFLQGPSREERCFYYKHAAHAPQWPRTPVTPQMWSALCHPKESSYANQVLDILADVFASVPSVDEAALWARDGQTPVHNELREIVQGVAYAMGLPAPPVVVDLELDDDILVLPTSLGLVFVLGRGFWQAEDYRARMHMAATALSFTRSHTQFRYIAQSPEHLELFFTATIASVHPEIPVRPELLPYVPSIHEILRTRLPATGGVRLQHAVEAFLASGEAFDAHKWWHAVACTSQRVATLIGQDLHTASRFLASQAAKGQPIVVDEVLRDLLPFSISSKHSEMRGDLGLAICEIA